MNLKSIFALIPPCFILAFAIIGRDVEEIPLINHSDTLILPILFTDYCVQWASSPLETQSLLHLLYRSRRPKEGYVCLLFRYIFNLWSLI